MLQNRTELIKVRITPEEKKKIQEAAKALKTKPSLLVRYAINQIIKK